MVELLPLFIDNSLRYFFKDVLFLTNDKALVPISISKPIHEVFFSTVEISVFKEDLPKNVFKHLGYS